MSLSTELSLRAWQVANKAFKDMPVELNHSLEVGDLVIEMGLGERESAVAYLHDVVEDTKYTLQDLRNLGFGVDIVEAVNAITHYAGEPYRDYIDRVKTNELAWRVKFFDLLHNISRNHTIEDKERRERLLKKYTRAVTYLITGEWI